MRAYSALAARYDELTRDVNYPARARYVDALIKRRGAPGPILADLACGTGSAALELSKLGYDLLCVDASSDMLSAASGKFDGFEQRPVFICQELSELDLFGTIDAAVCLLDSVNYIHPPERLKRFFARVRLFMNPGGVFIFDINSEAKLRGMDGETYCAESENAFCVWRNTFDRRGGALDFFVDLFERSPGGLWKRSRERHREFAYAEGDIIGYLEEAGFGDIELFGELSFEKPEKDEKRIFFSCRA